MEAIESVVKGIRNNGMLPVCMIRTSDFIVEESKAIPGSIVWPLVIGFVCKELYCEREKRSCSCASKCREGTSETKQSS